MTDASGLRASALWAGLFLVAAATIAAFKIYEVIGRNLGFILFAGSMFLLIPMYRAMARERTACAGRASLAYARRTGLFAFIYVIGLGITIAIDRSIEVSGAVSVLLAALPTAPILGIIWAMRRYLVEETDEFLRYRAVMAALFGLGVLLAVATFVGFLERFGLDVHPEGWLALPVWAIGAGVAQSWLARRDRVEQDA